MAYTFFSSPRPPLELQLLTFLHPRINLSSKYKKNYENLQKGLEGERKFFEILEKDLYADCIRLYGLRFEMNETEFQIDSLLIFKNKIYLFEIKNFAGDYYVKEDRWYVVNPGKEIRNPLHQLKRCELLLRQLLQQLGFNMQIKSYIVYVNSEFFLYQAPFDQSLVFPNQLMRFVKKLNTESGKISRNHKNLANQLARRHIPISTHERLPEYTYKALKKGIVCDRCHEFLTILNQTNLICKRCGNKELIDSAVIRSVKEFYTLFPDKKITTSVIHEWCQIIKSKKTIRRILKNNFSLVGSYRSTYFVLK